KISQSDHGKKKWEIVDGGGMLAAPSGGAITGFGAGVTGYEGFSGAIIVDDPLKPYDARSDPLRKKTNDQFAETLFSRLAHSDVPIIIIMQRLHEDDATAHLLKGGMNGEKWYHLNLSNPIPEKIKPYSTTFTHGIPIEHNLESGALWPYKHTDKQLKLMEASNPYVYYSQYAQEPTPPGGSIFKEDCFHYYTELPKIKHRFIMGDTAMKTGQHNDFSVFQDWGYGEDGNIYLLDQIRGKWEAPELESNAVAFWNKHNKLNGAGRLRFMGIEDKASGTGLIQKIKTENKIYVKAIQRDRDKISRAHDGVPFMIMGKVLLPKNAPWIDEYVTEFRKFNPEMTHAHDDQIDPTLDAIAEEFDPSELTSLGF
ncbi:MAG: phage terminase large subunit, partial [Thiotrichaceae bacterium]